MMEKKYQLVAWTKDITDKENARLYVVPSVENDLIKPFITEVTECRNQQKKGGGYISLKLARRFIRVYEQSARLDILTGNIDYAIRFLLQAAEYCFLDYPNLRRELRHQFIWYCEESLSLAHKYGFKQILDEKKYKQTLDIYWELTK